MPEIDNLSRMLDLGEFVFSKVLLRELLLALHSVLVKEIRATGLRVRVFFLPFPGSLLGRPLFP